MPEPSAATLPWDADVMRRVAAGDQAALAELYRQFGAMVFGLVQRITRSVEAGEEITQEVFLWVWSRAEAHDPSRSALRSWLAVVAHRRAVEWVRREVARRERQQREAALVVPPPSLEEEVLALTVAERVRTAVEALPEDQRAALRLAYFGGNTYREVAETLGIPEGTAKSRLRLALRKVVEAVEPEVVER